MEEPLTEKQEKPRTGLTPCCPKCQSTQVLTRATIGVRERLAIIFTGERKYRCKLCGWKFRARDPNKDSDNN